MQIVVLMNQPSLLFASVGEIQYGVDIGNQCNCDTLNTLSFKRSEQPGYCALTHFCYSPLLSLLSLSLRKEKIP